MANQFILLRSLLVPETPLWVGEVLSHESDGTSRIELPGGGIIQVRGQGVVVGLKAFVQGGEVKGEAPNLSSITIDI